MSVANIAFTEDRILCTSDTLVYTDQKPTALGERKADVAQSRRFAWVGRGSVALGSVYDGWLAQCEDLDAADDMVSWLMPIIGDADVRDVCLELHLLGWSDARGALSVVRHLWDGASYGRKILEPGVYLHPYASSSQPPSGLTAQQLVKVALGQQQFARRLGLPMCVGGLVHLTEVDRLGASQRIAAAYPDYEDDVARFGCPNYAAYQALRQRVA